MNLKKLLTAALLAGLVGIPSLAFAQSEKWIELHNKTGTTILHVYFSETYSDAWSRDALEGILEEEEMKTVRIRSHACMIDMRVRYANNARHELRFNICTAEHIDALPKGLVVVR